MSYPIVYYLLGKIIFERSETRDAIYANFIFAEGVTVASFNC